MLKKYTILMVGLVLVSQQIYSMSTPKIKIFGVAATTFGAVYGSSLAVYGSSLAVYGSSLSEHEIVKPAWATKYIPNGVPKKLDDQVQFMRNPEQFTKLGAELPKGLLLYGPPGTGKTTIARAIADELDATFISASGTDFSSHLYGKGSEKVRDFFKDARDEAAKQKGMLTIAFIDEIDSIAPHRGTRAADGYNEQITTLLTEIDGFVKDPKTKVYLIAATNRKESIDSALLRGGRLENHILIPAPSVEGRADILRHYLNKIAYKGDDISMELAKQTEGMTGADLKKIVNDAAIVAGSQKATAVNERHLRAVVPVMRQHLGQGV